MEVLGKLALILVFYGTLYIAAAFAAVLVADTFWKYVFG